MEVRTTSTKCLCLTPLGPVRYLCQLEEQRLTGPDVRCGNSALSIVVASSHKCEGKTVALAGLLPHLALHSHCSFPTKSRSPRSDSMIHVHCRLLRTDSLGQPGQGLSPDSQSTALSHWVPRGLSAKYVQAMELVEYSSKHAPSLETTATLEVGRMQVQCRRVGQLITGSRPLAPFFFSLTPPPRLAHPE